MATSRATSDDLPEWLVGVLFTLLAIPILAPYWIWKFVWPRLRRTFGPSAWLLVCVPCIVSLLAYLVSYAIGGTLQQSMLAFLAPVTAMSGLRPLAWYGAKVFFICATIGAPIYVIIFSIANHGNGDACDSHGSAYWASYHDVANAFPVREKRHLGGPMLGRMKDVPRKFCPCYRTSRHILTCAPTGSGKGVGCVVPNLLTYPDSCFVLDVKGENWAVTRRRRRDGHHRIFAIDPFGITREPSDTVDLFAAINPTSEDCVSESAALVETLIVRSPAGDPHWDDSAAHLLQGLILYVATLNPPQRHLGTLRETLTWSEMKLLALMQNLGSSTAAFGLIARSANAFLSKAERERSSVLSTAQRHTAFLDDPRIVRTLRGGEDAIDFADLKREPMTVYLCVPPDKLESYRGYVRAILGSALKSMIRTQEQPLMPVLFLVDEAAQLGYFKPLEDGVSLLRGYGVRLWLLVQDLSQLQAVYPRWKSFLANMTLQVFGTQDIDTARYISSRGNSTTTSAMGRALLTPDEVRRLDHQKVIVFEQGRPPVMLQRFNYLVDREFVGLFDPNPMHVR